MECFIVMMRENAYEPSDYIDSVWSTEEQAQKRASTFPELTPPEYTGYRPEVKCFILDTV